jgi:hypothetical protein
VNGIGFIPSKGLRTGEMEEIGKNGNKNKVVLYDAQKIIV